MTEKLVRDLIPDLIEARRKEKELDRGGFRKRIVIDFSRSLNLI